MMTAICKGGPFANVRGSRSSAWFSPSNRRAGRCARSGCGVDRWARLTADNVARRGPGSGRGCVWHLLSTEKGYTNPQRYEMTKSATVILRSVA